MVVLDQEGFAQHFHRILLLTSIRNESSFEHLSEGALTKNIINVKGLEAYLRVFLKRLIRFDNIFTLLVRLPFFFINGAS